jgi:hypothetical protein
MAPSLIFWRLFEKRPFRWESTHSQAVEKAPSPLEKHNWWEWVCGLFLHQLDVGPDSLLTVVLVIIFRKYQHLCKARHI